MLSKNIAWIFSSEAVNRATRLITAIVLARYLSPTEYGVAAIALASNEMIRVITQNGIGLKIVKSNDQQLDAVCSKVYRVNWRLCVCLVLIQIVAAFIMAEQYADNRLVYLISLLSLSYLIYPLAMVQVFLAQRDNNLKLIAMISAVVISTDNLLTALFVVLEFGVLAVVIPKILVAPLWVYLFRRNIDWRYASNIDGADIQLFKFSFNVLGYELLKALRQHADLFLVGCFFGLAEAGMYAFAKNVGIGISLALVAAFNSAVFPYLCRMQANFKEFRVAYMKALKIALFVLTPLFMLQAALAPIYVPIVFGTQWENAIPVLVVLCLSAIPRCFIELNTQLLRTMDSTDSDLKFSIYFTSLYLLGVLLAALTSIQMIAYSILMITLVCSLYWNIFNICLFIRNNRYFNSIRGVKEDALV